MKEQYQQWRTILQAKNPAELADWRAPLAGVPDCMGWVDESGNIPFVVSPAADLSVENASFKQLSHDRLSALRGLLYAGQEMEKVGVWAEKLMRYCEIYLPTLKRRALDKWGSPLSRQLGMLHLACFLLDYQFASQDLRCLNTVLKLMDLKWICHAQSVSQNLNRGGDLLVCALFQVRLYMLVDCALEQLGEEHG
jgi:hypothetical protein